MEGVLAFIGCMTTIEYEETVQRMRPRLVKLGGSFLQDDELAADAVQEALLRLWLLRERVSDEDYAEALLIRMTKNVCVSEWRRRQKHGVMRIEETSRIFSDEGQPMADDDNQRLLQEAIRTLSPQEQQLFRMRQEMGMDIPQIAAVTGLLPRSVSHVVSVARSKIVEQLKRKGIL